MDKFYIIYELYVYIPQMVLQISYVLAAICITLKDVTSLQTTCLSPDLLDFRPLISSSPGMTSTSSRHPKIIPSIPH